MRYDIAVVAGSFEKIVAHCDHFGQAGPVVRALRTENRYDSVKLIHLNEDGSVNRVTTFAKK